jgi:GntR family transcriptional regulator
VDRNVPIPLYYQLAELIRAQIRQGIYRPGDRLPGERELSARHGISRMTVRRGLEYLAHESLLEIRHGSGSYVAEPKLTFDALRLMGFSEAMLDRPGGLTSNVLEQGVHPAAPTAAAALQLAEGDPVVKVVRVRAVDGSPVALETNYLPQCRFPGLERRDLGRGSLYQILESEYGVTLDRVEQTFEAAAIGEFERRVLKAGAHVNILLVEGTTFDSGGVPVEYFRSSHRGDRFKVRVEGRRAKRAGVEHRHALSLQFGDGMAPAATDAVGPRTRGGSRP